jgi:hypothetical protein
MGEFLLANDEPLLVVPVIIPIVAWRSVWFFRDGFIQFLSN